MWILDTCGLSQDTWPYWERPCLRNLPAQFSDICTIHPWMRLDNAGSVPTVTSCLIASMTVLWLPVHRVFRELDTRSRISILGSPLVKRQRSPGGREMIPRGLLPPSHLLPVPSSSHRRTASVLALWSPYQAFWVGSPEPCWQPWKETKFQPRRGQLSAEQRVSKGVPCYQLTCCCTMQESA